ncbi:hypothetical protein CHS0354_018970, partial [Potamilus streckersoni]
DSMNVVKFAVQHMNTDQVPVAILDQRLFVITKTIQCKFLDTQGEDKLLIMFPGFHIETAAFK